jgi:hypothetical protein
MTTCDPEFVELLRSGPTGPMGVPGLDGATGPTGAQGFTNGHTLIYSVDVPSTAPTGAIEFPVSEGILKLYMNGMRPHDGSDVLVLRVSNDGGNTYLDTSQVDYTTSTRQIQWNSTNVAVLISTSSMIFSSGSIPVSDDISGYLIIHNWPEEQMIFNGVGFYSSTGTSRSLVVGGRTNAAFTANYIRIFFLASDRPISGRVDVYQLI